MDAVEFLKTRSGLCKVHEDCPECPLEFFCGRDYEKQGEIDYITKVISVVEQWAKEHPAKTRQSEFLKMFPNASIGYNDTLVICPSQADTKAIVGCVRSERNCDKCKHDFWLKEID